MEKSKEKNINLETKIEIEFVMNAEQRDQLDSLSNSSITNFALKKYEKQEVKYEEIKEAINKYLKNKPLILIGGQTASPLYYGYRSLRKPSTDIDMFASDKILERIVEETKIDVHKYYENSYIFISEKFPLVFHINKIHNYDPDEYFYKHVKEIDRILVNPPEYTIALKLKRAKDNKRMFGKDKIDIANILLSNANGKIELNYDKLSKLIKEFEIDSSYLDQIRSVNNLKKEEKYLIERQIEKIEKLIR